MKKFTKMFLAACLLTVFAFSVRAQSVGINATGDAPNSKAILDLSSTSKGFLPPRMTYLEKTAITSPPAGLMIWCTNCGTNGELQVYNGAAWTNLTGGAAPATVPGAPTGVSASAGNAQATVTFTAPASNGGSPITSYTAYSWIGGTAGPYLNQAGGGPITVTGLTNGTPYIFTVTATNANGTGAASNPSNSVTPATIPGAPSGVSATAGNEQATVTFTAPASNGGLAITSYTATSTPGNFTGTLTQAGSGTVTGLTNGTAYTFTVTATNTIGTGAASAASNPVTPATVPGAPTGVSATAGPAQATVTFTAPASNGGSPITSYTAYSWIGGTAGPYLNQAGGGPITVTGLTNGTAYTFTVKATNAAGTGAPSAASNAVTPLALAIGQSYGGGIIAYIDGTGQHGLIAATADQSTGISWAIPAYITTLVPGGTGTAIGTGLANTDNIIAQNGSGTTYAAGLARAYTGGSYIDWYLPSKDELAKLWELKALGFGGFAAKYYWSSSEYSATDAWFDHFSLHAQDHSNKASSYNYNVRAVRAF